MTKDVAAAEKIVRMIIKTKEMAFEVVDIGSKLNPKVDFFSAEDLTKLVENLRLMRTGLKNTRILLDAYLEAQEIYNEVYKNQQNTSMEKTNIPSLISQMSDEIQHYFRKPVEKND